MSFFKAYDMRGTFGVDFNVEDIYKIARAMPECLGAKRWLVGRDCRTTSAEIRDTLVSGLVDSGCAVVDIGRVTTPMVYHFTAEGDFDASVMITASHNPPSDNGMKVSKAGAMPVGYANGLCDIEKMIADPAFCKRIKDRHSVVPGGSSLKDVGYGFSYLEWHKSKVSPKEYEGLSFAVDCSNGMASPYAHAFFPRAEIINDTMDGTFPCHSPNPLKAEAREQLAKLVREKGLDCGVVFDGDADRAMFVDGEGEFIQPDYLIPVVYAAMNAQGGRVLHDVRTSRGAIKELERLGAEPVMVPVGHAFAKPAMREYSAVCGGELAGHYYFSDFHCCDSGFLAATRILKEFAKAKAKGMSVREFMRPIVSQWVNSGEINFKVEDKDAAIARIIKCASSFAPERSRSEIDGIRIEFDEGWLNVRKSNTEPYLRIVAECDTKSRLDSWLASIRSAASNL